MQLNLLHLFLLPHPKKRREKIDCTFHIINKNDDICSWIYIHRIERWEEIILYWRTHLWVDFAFERKICSPCSYSFLKSGIWISDFLLLRSVFKSPSVVYITGLVDQVTETVSMSCVQVTNQKPSSWWLRIAESPYVRNTKTFTLCSVWR